LLPRRDLERCERRPHLVGSVGPGEVPQPEAKYRNIGDGYSCGDPMDRVDNMSEFDGDVVDSGKFDVKGGEEDDGRISWNGGISPADLRTRPLRLRYRKRIK